MTSDVRRPYTANRSYRIDRQLGRLGLPRLVKASGTKDAGEFARINEMITYLVRERRRDLLEGLCTGRIRPLGLLELFEQRRLDEALRRIEAPGEPTPVHIADVRADDERRAERGGRMPMATDVPMPTTPVGPSLHRPPKPAAVTSLVPFVERDLRRGEDDGPVVDLATTPLWDALLSASTWTDAEGNADTVRRHLQALRGLRTRLRLAAAASDVWDVLVEMTDDKWEACDHVRRRGVSVHTIRALVRAGHIPRKHKPKKRADQGSKRAYSMARRRPAAPQAPTEVMELRLGHATMLTLHSLSDAEWEALEAVGPDVVSRSIIEPFHDIDDATMDLVAELGRILGPDAMLADLRRPRMRHFKALGLVWGGSSVDWNKARTALGAALTLLLRNVHAADRYAVMKEIPRKKEKAGLPDITLKQFQQIMEQCTEDWRAIFTTLLITGMRIGEFLRCERKHLLPNTHVIDVPGTKNDESQSSIAVAKHLWPYIERAIPSPVRYSVIRREWLRAAKRCGLTRVRLHDLRHCHARWATTEGATDRDVQASLRHATPGQTRRYQHDISTRRVADTLGKLIPPPRDEGS